MLSGPIHRTGAQLSRISAISRGTVCDEMAQAMRPPATGRTTRAGPTAQSSEMIAARADGTVHWGVSTDRRDNCPAVAARPHELLGRRFTA